MAELAVSPPQTEIYRGSSRLREVSYPGRLAIMGLDLEGNAQIAYALTGRSESSRRRVLMDEGYGSVRTTAPGRSAAEMADTPNAALIYYQATKSGRGIFVVSNGAQTAPVFERIDEGATLEQAVKLAPVLDGVDLSSYEPDAPNYTPRITGVIDLRDDAPTPFGLAVVRKQSDSDEPEHSFYKLENGATLPVLGVGYGIRTYLDDGDPLPAYDEPPFPFPLSDSAVGTAERLWSALDEDRRVALVVQAIDLEQQKIVETCIVNSPA